MYSVVPLTDGADALISSSWMITYALLFKLSFTEAPNIAVTKDAPNIATPMNIGSKIFFNFIIFSPLIITLYASQARNLFLHHQSLKISTHPKPRVFNRQHILAPISQITTHNIIPISTNYTIARFRHLSTTLNR